MSLSVVIPTLDAGPGLVATLRSLRLGRVDEVVVSDGGSADGTPERAAGEGATVVRSERGRGLQLARGADAASGDWLLFLHADTRLEPGWRAAANAFIGDPASRERAAHFRFALDDSAPGARRLERIVAWRCRRLGLPYGDQGLLIFRPFYERVGGFRPLPLMEDVDLARRIGRHRLVELPARAITSAVRYRQGGYLRRSLRNTACLAAWGLGVPPRTIARFYG